MKAARPASDLVKRSLLYRETQAENEEISRHKWLESEKQGHDIGWDRARMDWRMKHQSKWSRERRAQRTPHTYEI